MNKCLVFFLTILIVACSQEQVEVADHRVSYIHCDKIEGPFRVCYGPGWDSGTPQNPKNFNIYTISIERELVDGSLDLHTEIFGASKINKDFLVYHKEGSVQIDKIKKEITFNAFITSYSLNYGKIISGI
jgi:hypothetical protein